MSDPQQLALVLQFILAGGVSLVVVRFLRVGVQVTVLFACICLPVPLTIIKGHHIFAGDIAGLFILFVSALQRGPIRHTTTSCDEVRRLYALGIVLWPIASAYAATQTLGETISAHEMIDFCFRSAVQFGLIGWGYRIGRERENSDHLLMVPVLLWLAFSLLGLTQFAGFANVDAYWFTHQEYLRADDLTSGFMGMDKGQLGAWAAFVPLVCLWMMPRRTRALAWASSCTIGLSALIILLVGSRLGLVALLLGGTISAVLQLRPDRRTPHLPKVLVTICLGLLIAPFVLHSMDPGRWNRALKQLNALLNISSVRGLSDARDPTALPLLNYIVDSPQRLIFGSGIATEQWGTLGLHSRTGFVNMRWGIRTYAEAEFLRLLWSGGLITLGAYILILAILLRASLRAMRCSHVQLITHSACLLCCLTLVGLLTACGQYHLATVSHETNLPWCYVLWILSAVLLGMVQRRQPHTILQHSFGHGQRPAVYSEHRLDRGPACYDYRRILQLRRARNILTTMVNRTAKWL
jgi:hypothetical protein